MRRLGMIRVRAARAVRRSFRDLLAIAGIGCIAIGLAFVAPSLSWIVIGGFLLMAARAGESRAR